MSSESSNRSRIRQLVDSTLRNDAELEAFCIDFFPETQKRFTRSMERVEKINLLLTLEHCDSILNALRGSRPSIPAAVEVVYEKGIRPRLYQLASVFCLAIMLASISIWVFVFSSRENDQKSSAAGNSSSVLNHADVAKNRSSSELREHFLTAGIWRTGSTPQVLLFVDSQTFFQYEGKLQKDLFQLIDLKTLDVAGFIAHIGLWSYGNVRQLAMTSIPQEDVGQFAMIHGLSNKYPIDLEISSINDAELNIDAVLREGNTSYSIVINRTPDEFKKDMLILSRRGFRLVDVEIYQTGGSQKFAGLFHPGTDECQILFDLDAEAFKSAWKRLGESNLRLADIESYRANGHVRYAGVWRTGDDAHHLELGISYQELYDHTKNLSAKGLRLSRLEFLPR